jgi:hypothetical protein
VKKPEAPTIIVQDVLDAASAGRAIGLIEAATLIASIITVTTNPDAIACLRSIEDAFRARANCVCPKAVPAAEAALQAAADSLDRPLH